MGWADVKKGSGNFLVLKDDGQAATFVPLGDCEKQVVKNKEGKDRKRYYINAFVAGQEKCSIFPMNVTVAEQLKDALQIDPENDPKLTKTLLGRVAVTVTRHGKAAAKAEQVDLTTIEATASDKF
jgi:hypothetical protein